MNRKELDEFWTHLEKLYPAPYTHQNHNFVWTVSSPGELQAVFKMQLPTTWRGKDGSVKVSLLMVNQERAQALRSKVNEQTSAFWTWAALRDVGRVSEVSYLTERHDGIEGVCQTFVFHEKVFYDSNITGALGMLRMLEEPVLDLVEYLATGGGVPPAPEASYYPLWYFTWRKKVKSRKRK